MRLRTLLQTFDAARFSHDNAVAGVSLANLRKDAVDDIALARSEILGAVLFGHEIVVPAGAVADSPAFVSLMADVLEPSVEQRAKISVMNGGVAYHPFRIGLENRFEKPADGKLPGYDAFLRDYLGDYQPGHIDLKVLAHLAQKSDRTEQETMVLIGNAYLSGDLAAIKGVDERYERHVESAFLEFSNRLLTPAPSIYAASDPFSTAAADTYSSRIRSNCAQAEANDVNYSGLAEITRVTDEIEKELAINGKTASASARGVWYKRGHLYGDHWQVVRAWLDRRIMETYVSGYGVALPSLFTQKISSDDDTATAALIHLPPSLVKPWLDQASTNILPRLPMQIDWKAIWDMLADPDVQREMTELQHKLTTQRADELKTHATIEKAEPDVAAVLRKNRSSARGQVIEEAVDAYVRFINGGQNSIVLTSDASGGSVTVKQKSADSGPLSRKAVDVIGGAAVGEATTAAVTSQLPTVAAVLSSVTGVPVAAVGGVIWEATKFSAKAIAETDTGRAALETAKGTVRTMMGVVVREPDTPILEGIARDQKRKLSFWMAE